MMKNTLLLSLLLLVGSVLGNNCMYKLPQCGDSIMGLSIADYELVTGNNAPSGQSVCFSSNTTQYSVVNTTVRIYPSNSNHKGDYCTNVSLTEEQACARNGTPNFNQSTVMHFNMRHVLDTVGTIQVNFTRVSGDLRTSFTIQYAPSGIYTNNPTEVTVSPGSSLVLVWTVYNSTGIITHSHTDTDNVTRSPGPGTFSLSLMSNCIKARTGGTVVPQRPVTAVVNIGTFNYEFGGVFTLMTPSFMSQTTIKVPEEQAPPVLSTSSSNIITVLIGSTVTISCDYVNSIRTPSWYFNEVPLASDGSQYSITNTGLTIRTVTLSESGSYTCMASNEVGSSARHFLLRAGSTPIITVPPFDITIQNDSSVVLPCTATGLPYPNVEWFVDSVKVQTDTGIDATSGSLYIESVTNSVNVTCRVYNIFGSAVASANLSTITVSGNNVTSLNQPFNTISGSSQEVTLYCRNSHSFGISYQWTKDNVALNGFTERSYTVNSTDDGSNWGLYCCKVSRAGSLIDERCSMITVRTVAQVVTQLTNFSLSTGSVLSLYCSTNTSNNIDLPPLQWMKDNVLLTATGSRYSYNQNFNGFNTLQIRNVTTNDSGMYTCTGVNFVSTVTTTSHVRVIDTSVANNIIRGSTADGDMDTSRSVWGITASSGGYIAGSSGEGHYGLLPSVTISNPALRQNVTLEKVADYTLYFRCRMRTNNVMILPVVSISALTINTINITLPFPSLLSWQWVSHYFNIITTDDNEILSVTLATSGFSLNRVFFDDISLSVVTSSVLPVPSNVIPSSTPTSSMEPPSQFTLFGLSMTYLIIIGAAIVVALLILLMMCLCCVICCCRRMNKRKKNKAIDFNKRISQELKNGIELRSASRYTSLDNKKPPQNTSDTNTLPQPVYIMPGGGTTPVYMDTNSPENTHLLSAQSSRVSTISASGMYEELKTDLGDTDEITEMYDNVTVPDKIEEAYSPEHTTSRNNMTRFNSGSSPPNIPLPPIPSGHPNTNSVYMSIDPSSRNDNGVYESPLSPTSSEGTQVYADINNSYVQVISKERMESEDDYV